MKKNIIKKVINKLKIATLVTLIVGTTAAMSSCSKTATVPPEVFDEPSYADNTQIEKLFNDLDCDSSYINKNFVLVDNEIVKTDRNVRLAHNDGEPIYITISDEYSSGRQRENNDVELIKIALDKVFGLIGQINDMYYYEIVETAPTDKSSISFQVADLEDNTQGQMLTLQQKEYCNWLNIIYLDNNFIKEGSEREKLYTLTHELLHVFGFADVYVNRLNSPLSLDFRGKIKANTFMQNQKYRNITYLNDIPITPNDYKCLMALYAENATSEIEYFEMLERIKELVSEYEKSFYSKWVDWVDGKNNNNNYIGYKKVKFPENYSLTVNDYLDNGYKMKVEVQAEKYKVSFIDDNGKTISSCNGNVIYVKGSAILQNVETVNVKMFGVTGLCVHYGDIVLSMCSIKNVFGDENIHLVACGYVDNHVNKDISKFNFEEELENESNLGV